VNGAQESSLEFETIVRNRRQKKEGKRKRGGGKDGSTLERGGWGG